ncbi:MAG: serine/threonine-protein kinase, partial [Myxococcota bacterium]
GMGTVFLARQTEPVDRFVALKVINGRFHSQTALARFQQEQQALARLTHENIAQLYDAGATDEGEPYFLMEFVEGDPIDEYAKSHTLSVPARLKLFAQACRAVQFAHQRGILHRDLKPANLLVQHREEGPTVKLIDFGIARVADDTGASGLTGTSILGTPAYMAPEAFDREITADIRQDVYSLGLVLFELIVGTHPLRGKSAVEVAKSYAETRELDPSEIWRAADAKTQTVVLSERQSNPREMVDSLKGDLGAVIRKATAQDSDARYDSVSHLADDVGRYLDGYPVEATNPTTSDRFARFVARHRLIVAAAVLAVLSLVTGVVVSVRSAAQANAQAQIAKSAKSFLVDLFRSSDPTLSRGKELTVKQALKAGTEEILASPNTMDTKLRADMALTIGEVYYTLGA